MLSPDLQDVGDAESTESDGRDCVASGDYTNGGVMCGAIEEQELERKRISEANFGSGELECEDKMYLIHTDSDNSSGDGAVLESVTLSDETTPSMVVSRSLHTRSPVTSNINAFCSPHSHSALNLAPGQLVTSHTQVLTLDQLTPERLLDLQTKGLLQIASTPSTSFIVSTRGGGIIPVGGQPPSINVDSYRNSMVKASEEAMEPIHDMCVVCGDRASGRHYGAKSCEGCKGFFKRSIRKKLVYTCRGSRDCSVNKVHRNRCQYCRLQKCILMGMKSDSVQCERSPMHKQDSAHRLIGLTPESLPPENSQTRNQLTAMVRPRPSLENSDKNQGNLSTLANVVSTMAHLSKEENENSTEKTKRNTDERNGKPEDTMKALESLNKTLKTCFQGSNDILLTQTQTPILDFEGPVMTEVNFPFDLSMPSPSPDVLNANYICESASRLLFLSAQWARSIFAFQLLSAECHTTLLRECWHELFTLGLSQCARIMNFDRIIVTIINHLKTSLHEAKLSSSRIRSLTCHINKLQDFIMRMQKLEVNHNEYAYLKAIALFSPDNVKQSHRTQIHRFQSRTVSELREYEIKQHADDHDRMSHLLLLLPSLRSLNSALTEELFFAGLIGNVQIDSIIPYILRMESDFTSETEVSSSPTTENQFASDTVMSHEYRNNELLDAPKTYSLGNQAQDAMLTSVSSLEAS